MKVSVKTPATIANLGCGFDSFGLAIVAGVLTLTFIILPIAP